MITVKFSKRSRVLYFDKNQASEAVVKDTRFTSRTYPRGILRRSVGKKKPETFIQNPVKPAERKNVKTNNKKSVIFVRNEADRIKESEGVRFVRPSKTCSDEELARMMLVC